MSHTVLVDERMATASDTLLLIAVLCYLVAVIGFAGELVLRPRPRLRPIAGGATDTLPVDWTVTAPPRDWGAVLGRAAVAVTTIGVLVHVASIVTRGLAADRVPWGNMYEFSSVVSCVAVAGFLGLLRRHPVRRLGVFVLVPAVLFLGLASTVLYAPAAPLIPALNSYWIKIHVSAAMTASGLFLVGFVVNVLYLIRERADRAALAQQVDDDGDTARAAARLPSAQTLDDVAFRVIGVAFVVWTFAVIAGAIWAEAAWGRYWGWDPKETWSFVTWVFYAGYLHARATAGWRGRRAAWVGVVGFAALMFCYYGVNLWISGLHSYAGV